MGTENGRKKDDEEVEEKGSLERKRMFRTCYGRRGVVMRSRKSKKGKCVTG